VFCGGGNKKRGGYRKKNQERYVRMKLSSSKKATTLGGSKAKRVKWDCSEQSTRLPMKWGEELLQGRGLHPKDLYRSVDMLWKRTLHEREVRRNREMGKVLTDSWGGQRAEGGKKTGNASNPPSTDGRVHHNSGYKLTRDSVNEKSEKKRSPYRG